MKTLYKPYRAPRPSLGRCKSCPDHAEHGNLKWGWCRPLGMSAYYTQLDGYCRKIAAELVEKGRDNV